MGLPGKRVVFRELNAGGRRKDRVKIERRWVRREELRVFEEARREWLRVFEDSERIQLRKMKRNRRGVRKAVGAVGQVTQESCVVQDEQVICPSAATVALDEVGETPAVAVGRVTR